MDELPVEIIVHIFQYLSKKEQIKISESNKKFREALFSPSLWMEHDMRLKVPASQMKSFREFLKQTPWLKYLNLLVIETESPSIVNLTSVLKSLNNLECLSLQLKGCKPIITFFPSTLKHISLGDFEFGNHSFITATLLKRLADSCPRLEHIQITSYGKLFFTRKDLIYLLKKVELTLQTFILKEPFSEDNDPVFYLYDCPPNLTTLCLGSNFETFIYDGNGLKFPSNLENLQILSLYDQSITPKPVFSTILVNCSLHNLRLLYLSYCYPFEKENFYAKISKLPNLQVLYIHNCGFYIDELVNLVKGCSSLKALAWKRGGGYTEEEMFELEKLTKETPVKIYLNDKPTDISPKYATFYPNFPNKNFYSIKTFNIHMFHEIFIRDLGLHTVYDLSHLFKCYAPNIKNSKAFLDTIAEM